MYKMVVGKFRQIIEMGKKALKKVKDFVPTILRVYRTVAPAVTKAVPQLEPIRKRADEFADVGEAAVEGDFNKVVEGVERIGERIEKGKMLPSEKEWNRARERNETMMRHDRGEVSNRPLSRVAKRVRSKKPFYKFRNRV